MRSRFIVSIALSMPFTTLVMFPVTCRIVMAVSTQLATVSRRLARQRRFSDLLFLQIAFDAYIRALLLLPCWSACTNLQNKSCLPSEFLLEGYVGKEAGGKVEAERRGRGDGDGIHCATYLLYS